jgi:hypothetical protein
LQINRQGFQLFNSPTHYVKASGCGPAMCELLIRGSEWQFGVLTTNEIVPLACFCLQAISPLIFSRFRTNQTGLLMNVGYFCLMILASWGLPLLGYAGEAVDENPTSPGSQRPWPFGQAAPFSRPIVTDRPSFSVGPGMVPRGCIQFETGYTFSFEDAHPNVKTHTFPETLVRIGLTDRVEFRLEWPTLTIIENGTDVH